MVGLTGTVFLQYLAFATAPLIAVNVICYADGVLAALWVAARRPTRSALATVPLALVGFAGVIVVLTDGGSPLGGVELGYLFALGSAVCMAGYSLASGRSGVPAGSTLSAMLLPATVLGATAALASSLIAAQPWPPPTAWLGAVYLGLGPMAAGYALWTHAMADGRADRLVPLCYATPLLSTALLLATGEPATTGVLVGGALVLVCVVGVLLTERRHRRADPARPPAVPPARQA